MPVFAVENDQLVSYLKVVGEEEHPIVGTGINECFARAEQLGCP